MTTIIILSIFTAIILTAALLLQTGAYYLVERPTDKAIAEATTRMEPHTAFNHTLKRNAANRRIYQPAFAKRCILKRNSAKRCTRQSPVADHSVRQASCTPHVERRLIKSNFANRRTRQAGYAHRVERRLRKGTRCTSQPTQTKSQGHWHVPEAPKGAPGNQDINPLASRFNSAVNNLKARRRALKRLAGELMEFDPEYMFT